MIISYLFICWMPSHVLEHKSTEHLEPSQTLYIKWVFFCLPILTSVQAHWGQVRWVSYLSFCHGCLDLCLPGSMWLVKSGRVSLRKMSEWCSQQCRPKWADFQVTLHNWKSYQKQREWNLMQTEYKHSLGDTEHMIWWLKTNCKISPITRLWLSYLVFVKHHKNICKKHVHSNYTI